MKLRPLHDHLIIKPIEEVTKGGIVLPDSVDREKSEKGEVLAIGVGKLLENGQRAPIDVKVGDKVIFKKYSPDEVKVGDDKFLVISESDVIAVIE